MDSVIQKEEERDGFSYAIVRFETFTAIGEEELSRQGFQTQLSEIIIFLGLQLIPLL